MTLRNQRALSRDHLVVVLVDQPLGCVCILIRLTLAPATDAVLPPVGRLTSSDAGNSSRAMLCALEGKQTLISWLHEYMLG